MSFVHSIDYCLSEWIEKHDHIGIGGYSLIKYHNENSFTGTKFLAGPILLSIKFQELIFYS